MSANRSVKTFLALLAICPLIIGWIRKGVALFQEVQTAQDAIQLFSYPGLEFNWPFIYDWMALGGIAALLIIYWDALSEAYIKRQRKIEYNKRQWNMPVVDAINWVATASYFGKSLNSGAYTRAAAAIAEYIKSGKLEAAGIRLGEFNQKPIPKEERSTHRLICSYYRSNSYTNTEAQKARDAYLGDPGGAKAIWSGLLVDRRQVEELFPSKRLA
jgi:hypothetical protein